MSEPLRIRWLGTVPYRQAFVLQRMLFRGSADHLVLLEHPHVFTHGPGAKLDENVKVDPADVGAELIRVNRGGDVTYHGPGQLVGYPIVSVGAKHGGGGPADTLLHVCTVEQLIIDSLGDLGLTDVGRLTGYPGVWVEPGGERPRKICAIGVRVSRGRTMHGFGLNVTTDMRYLREYIVACGLTGMAVTSLAEEGVDASMRDVVDAVARRAAQCWGGAGVERQDVAWRHRPDDLSLFSRGAGPGESIRSAAGHGVSPTAGVTAGVSVRVAGRLAEAGVTDGLAIAARKPEWLRPKVRHGAEVLAMKRTVREHGLVTVCEEAGCPNLSECWADGTATFMVLGERCTRACGFCLVDTRLPAPPAPDEPARVAAAVAATGLAHAVLTMVARDDLGDGGMAHVAACVTAIHERTPATAVETLISDAKGDLGALRTLFDAKPEVVNHNVETVPRLQRAVRPSAGYASSLAVLSAAKEHGLVAKSGLIVGLGETDDEVDGVLADLAAIGVDIVTIGQYLRPTTHHMPVARWVEPDAFSRWAAVGRELGIGHVEASPLTRSSYHARQAAENASPRLVASPGR